MTVRLSLIIPVYNEAEGFSSLMNGLRHFQAEEDLEIIFVDGGSHDQTVSLLRNSGFKVYETKKGRGKQLKYGADRANGEIFLFLHADSYFKKSPVKEIYQLIENGKMGAFPLRFEPNNWLLDAIARGSNWRIKHRQIAFGDQGMFMTRYHYFQLGGFREIALMEDYDLSLRNKAQGNGILLAKTPIYTSSRRFSQHGTLKTLLRMQYCQWLYRRGVDIKEIQAIYTKKSRKEG